MIRDKVLNKIIIGLVIVIVLLILVFVYLDKTQYNLTLLGESDITLYLNDDYREYGYVAYNGNNFDVTSDVKVSGSVDTNKLGDYKITYKIGWVKVYRTIHVVYDQRLDLTLFLENEETCYILKNSSFIPLKAKAFDLIDGDISKNVVVNHNVNTSNLGEYDVNYTVVNSRGISKTISSKVVVYDIEYNISNDVINGKLVYKFNINSDLYVKTKLPDGTYTSFNNFDYTFVDNGKYVFYVYDKYNNIKEININVNGIDKIKPTGTCYVNLYDDYSKVFVNANDNGNIKGYVYHYGENDSKLVGNNNYVYYDMTDKVYVTIYDEFDNNIKIECSSNDLSTHYGRIYTTQNDDYKYKLYIPDSLSKRNKLPLVIFFHGMGECGGSTDRVNANSFPKYISEGNDYDFVMIAPHDNDSNCSGMSSTSLKGIIDDVIKKYPIDSHRVIVTGFSLGTYYVYDLIIKYPNFFAGAIPVAGGTSYNESLLKTNIWAFVGEWDITNYERVVSLGEKVMKGNPNSKFTVIKGASHAITEEVYKNKEVIDWIMNAYR